MNTELPSSSFKRCLLTSSDHQRDEAFFWCQWL